MILMRSRFPPQKKRDWDSKRFQGVDTAFQFSQFPNLNPSGGITGSAIIRSRARRAKIRGVACAILPTSCCELIHAGRGYGAQNRDRLAAELDDGDGDLRLQDVLAEAGGELGFEVLDGEPGGFDATD